MSNSITILGKIITFILGFFSTYIILDFMSKFERNLYYKKIFYITAYFIFNLIILMSKVYCSETLNFIITIGVTLIIGHFLYNNKKIYILYYSLYIITLIIFQFTVILIFQLLCVKFNINFYSGDIFVITTSIIVQFSNLIASRLFIACYKKKKVENITSIQYLNFLVLPVFSIFYITTLMMYVQTYLAMEDIILLLINIISIILLNIFTTNIFQSISKNNELKNQLNLYNKQAEINYEYYNSLENKYKNSRKVIHDIKNHMQTIEGLYKINEYEKAKKYRDDMYVIFESLGQKYYSRNRVLNIILNDKIQKAEGYGIKFQCNIKNSEINFIEDIDITTIFSNLLDNSIDGVKGLTKDKCIVFKMDKFNDFILINITNPLSEMPIKNKTKFKSTKKDHKGIGLINVLMALQKYEGNMRISYDNNNFKVNIVIPSN
ncbi:sensor histidine kinase [Haloimpatiens sp. FM7315]|uniref:sensor histidine kinase n=1 Tax=Haloimpatiens sp. FM7315 TaxID=3298609 RepID=UPI00370A7DF7